MNGLTEILAAILLALLLMLSGVSGNTEEIQVPDNLLELDSTYLSVMSPEIQEIPIDEPELSPEENDVAADGLADEPTDVELEVE